MIKLATEIQIFGQIYIVYEVFDQPKGWGGFLDGNTHHQYSICLN